MERAGKRPTNIIALGILLLAYWARAFALDRSFQADQRRQPERGQQLDHVSRALQVAAQQRGG